MDDRGGETPEEAYDEWIKMVMHRLPHHIFKKNINDHPVYIQNKLQNLNYEQFGYDCFGLLDQIKPNAKAYINLLKNKIRYPMVKI